MNSNIDPVKYEIFIHRLNAIGEEGRIALQKVSASPIVVQGGECMCAFYTPDAEMAMACTGHLRFSAASSGAIRSIIENYSANPGFTDGDQFFFNDPYVASAHTEDQMAIKPIFRKGKLFAWIASSSHTADVGGRLGGEEREIYEEGIKFPGIKIVEKGQLRNDVYKSIVEQCRDPVYVGLDMMSRIAANNVCAQRLLEAVDRFGEEFVTKAFRKLIDDGEALARAKLKALPDGEWTARGFESYYDSKSRSGKPIMVMCKTTKIGDSITFDFTGSSPQTESYINSTAPGTEAQVFGPTLTDYLFWDVPWNDGKLRPVKLILPKGSIVNCTFPTACKRAPRLGSIIVDVVRETIARMLFASGRLEDINASGDAHLYREGFQYVYGGHNREGIPVAQLLLDIHGSGFGATPLRDGVNCAGHFNVPYGGMNDVERIEMNYPFIYFARNYLQDGGGFGKYQGGVGSYRMFLVYGSKDLSTAFQPYEGVPTSSSGLFGGFPFGTGGYRIFKTTSKDDLLNRLERSQYPTNFDEFMNGNWGELLLVASNQGRVVLPEYSIGTDFTGGGGGYGDPLHRNPDLVLRDFRDGIISRNIATGVYGVEIDGSGSIDSQKTSENREKIRQERIKKGRPFSGSFSSSKVSKALPTLRTSIRFHEYLELATDGKRELVRCLVCKHVFCSSDENYKMYASKLVQSIEDLGALSLPGGKKFLALLHEYVCPKCGTMLDVDVHIPGLSHEEPLWDTRLLNIQNSHP